ncbi:GAD-like domain-containing protein [Paraburkholderia phosphatilytica]|uniref:GAD-like domain-containing protein n=1 Tax=Paraburkholderia phosphatilytica TaxID=2282883 RepID=UPI000E48029C|nr:GAD-like domain-containing protein [Paraburkholderia phosphatilytica]
MRGEDSQVFIDEFGEATLRIDAPESSIGKWSGKLPDRILEFWKDEGWSAYADGLLWIVDPDDYEDIVDEWLDGSGLDQIDAFHAIARTAFGKLYIFGESTGQSVTINCVTNSIFALPRNLKKRDQRGLDISVRSFFCTEQKACDLADEEGKRLFKRALSSLGLLAADEMYGFEPAIVLGGKMQLENLRKVKLDQHLTILRQLAAPNMPFSGVDIDSLIQKP